MIIILLFLSLWFFLLNTNGHQNLTMTLIRYMVADKLIFDAGHSFPFEYIISISLVIKNV